MKTPDQWLRSTGDGWSSAAQEAADHLLESYPYRHSRKDRIDLVALAGALGVRLKQRPSVSGEARLIPASGGFVVHYALPNASGFRYRTSIAHELAHTLFYSRSYDPPRRLFAWTEREESFCFDVARKVMAPRWLLDELGFFTSMSLEASLDTLVSRVGLSHPLAGRVIFADYKIEKGVAGRWKRKGTDTWVLERSTASASPDLTAKSRRTLHLLAEQWLATGTVHQDYRVTGNVSGSGRTAFVAVCKAFEDAAPSHQLSLFAAHRTRADLVPSGG